MDTGRQVIRWALPGWITFLVWAGFITVSTLLHDQSQPTYLEIIKKTRDLIILLGVASIPIGFVIYQLYYWTYWYLPVPSVAGRKLVDPVDRGKEILSAVKQHVDFGPIFFKRLNDTPDDPFKKCGPITYKSPKVMKEYRENWHLADSAWYFALSDDRYKNTAEYLEKRNQLLGDIYHSLGACQHALALAYLGYILAVVYVSFTEFGTNFSGLTSLLSGTVPITMLETTIPRLVSPAVNFILFFLVFLMFRGGRMASFDALFALKHDVITNVMLNKPTKLIHFKKEIPEETTSGQVTKIPPGLS